jgi:hypothetical protein
MKLLFNIDNFTVMVNIYVLKQRILQGRRDLNA